MICERVSILTCSTFNTAESSGYEMDFPEQAEHESATWRSFKIPVKHAEKGQS